ncbi:cysteine-rich receptor-like protein kinase 1 isoform X2 [Tripterygium wilfordii]|nr:cysteine-rich receptor-like protein kinase 1 isoform X2 [Tripterygium wilfordii]
MHNLIKQVANHLSGSYFVATPSPAIYGMAQCHRDLSPVDCQVCFSEGRVKLPKCLPSSSARIFLDGCFLRYDNYSFFNEATDPKYDYVNCSSSKEVLTDKSLLMDFNSKVAQVIKNVTETAVVNKGFAVSEVRGGVVAVYALAQCWTTLDADSCRLCLNLAGSKLRQCKPGAGGRALYAGCYMRYSTERFFNIAVDTEEGPDKDSYKGIIIGIVLSAVAFVLLASFGAYIGYKRLSEKKKDQNSIRQALASSNRSSLNFKYEALEKATDYFNESRKLGQGGAGSVFKGILLDGRVVAVKRLVYNTRQWVDQFFNEVNLISGIQHKNIVSLLGCSIEGPESLLVYEFVPNRSLDQILFAKSTIHVLNWQQRFSMILGIAEGLAYLHGGSGVKIIHRDIKASNILLDENFTSKIADFGLARCAASDQSHISTGIAGTLGYMAPEYLVKGQLTEKADVYSFGVLILEISTGRKNTVFSQGSDSILHSVWKHYERRTLTKTVDAGLEGIFPEEEASKVLQIGLLCTQASAALRPSMSEVVQMLNDKECVVPSPKQPPFLNASVLSPDDSNESSIITSYVTPKDYAARNKSSSDSRLSSIPAIQESIGSSETNQSGQESNPSPGENSRLQI